MKLITAFLLALGTAVAAAQPAEVLPFVEGHGMVAAVPRYSDLVRLLGEPPVSSVRPERLEPAPQGRARRSFWDDRQVRVGGEHDIGYPQQGLAFTIDRTDRPLRDPPVHWMREGSVRFMAQRQTSMRWMPLLPSSPLPKSQNQCQL